jgi:hypothetical protein
MKGYDEEVYNDYINSCENQERYRRAHEKFEYGWINLIFFFVIVLFALMIVILNVGFGTVFEYVFYLVSLHWFLKLIVDCREGDPCNKQFSRGMDGVIDDDEEMAAAMCDTTNDVIEDEEGEDKKQN